MICSTCNIENTTRRCVKCGGLLEAVPDEPPTLTDWLGSKKIQRRLSAGTWGADHPKRMKFPTDGDPYEPAERPIIPMPPSWYDVD